MPVANEVRHTVRNHPRLARSRACEDQQRPIPMQHGFALFRVEFGEEVHGGGWIDYIVGGSVARWLKLLVSQLNLCF
jgi:hypothetical protein